MRFWITKNLPSCASGSENECRQCFCRPMWCLSCLGRWFASRQNQERPETWLASCVPCPTCRSKFCILDVCLIRWLHRPPPGDWRRIEVVHEILYNEYCTASCIVSLYNHCGEMHQRYIKYNCSHSFSVSTIFYAKCLLLTKTLYMVLFSNSSVPKTLSPVQFQCRGWNPIKCCYFYFALCVFFNSYKIYKMNIFSGLAKWGLRADVHRLQMTSLAEQTSGSVHVLLPCFAFWLVGSWAAGLARPAPSGHMTFVDVARVFFSLQPTSTVQTPHAYTHRDRQYFNCGAAEKYIYKNVF